MFFPIYFFQVIAKLKARLAAVEDKLRRAEEDAIEREKEEEAAYEAEVIYT